MEQKRTIILASASPRRKELLGKIGLKFIVDPSDYPEDLRSATAPVDVSGRNFKPEDLAKSLSLEKALVVSRKYKDAIIIAADTFGVLRGKIIGKPHTENEAMEMLQSLSGKFHRVITGFTIIDSASNKMAIRAVETRVFIKDLSPEEIASYVKTGEPLDKAGAYAIQGLGAVMVEKIIGDYYNVMGLPLNALVESLKDFGIRVL